MRSRVLEVDTERRRTVDLTAEVRAFCRDGGDGLLSVFAPHATVGLALIETGSGSEHDLESAIDRLLPRDAGYAHRHGAPGHGADHVLPAFVSPSLVIPVDGGIPALGRWQRVVLVDPNVDHALRRVRLSLLASAP